MAGLPLRALAAVLLFVGTSPDWRAEANALTGLCGIRNCDVVWALNRRIDESIRSKSRALAQGVRGEFERAMNHLFDQKIRPLIGEFDGILERRTAQVEQAVNGWLVRFDSIVESSAKHAEQLVGFTAEQIRDNLIREAASQVERLSEAISSDINGIIDKFSCELDGSVEAATAKLRELLPTFSGVTNRWDQCYYRDSNYLGTPNATEYGKIYAIQSCLTLREIENGKTSAKTVMAVYVDLSNLARRTRCVIKTGVGDDYYGREMQRWQALYLVGLRAGAEQ